MKEYTAFTLKDPALGEWKDIKNTEILNEEGKLIGMSPRKIQLEIIDQLSGKQNTIINAPGGSGKSKAAQFLHAPALIEDPNKKLIIAVPKKIIQKGFGDARLHLPDGEVIFWEPINLCDNSTEKKKELLEFLNDSSFPKGINERILITTHQALAGLFSELVEQKLINKKIFHNTSIVIDEANTLLNVEQEETGITISNGIGSLITYALKCQEKDPTIGVHLMDAALFRGDTYSLLLKKDLDKFTTYYLPIDKHWEENIQYIEDYSYNYVVYKGGYWKEINILIKRHKDENILFFLPRGEAKYKVAEKIKKLLKKYKVKGKVCDLVEDRSVSKREKLVKHINENENDYGAVLTVDIFNEGADWPPCEVIIDLEPASGSLPKAIQRWLRAFRDKDYKKHLHYYSFLPFVLDTLDEEKYLTILNRNFTAFMLSMIIEDAVNPILIPRPKGEGTDGKREEKVDYLTEVVKDIHKISKIKTDIVIDLIALKAQADKEDKILTTKDIEKSITLTLKKNKVKKNIVQIALQIFVALKRNVSKYRGVDVDNLVKDGYNEVKKGEVADEIFKDILIFPAMITGMSFAKLKEIYDRIIYKTEEEHVELIKEKDLKTTTLWGRYWKNNDLQKEGYISVPWRAFDKTGQQFFEQIWGKNKTEQEHVKLIKDKNIKNSPQWYKIYNRDDLQEKKYYHSPWDCFGKKSNEFFEEIWGPKYKAIKEHIDIVKKNNLYTCSKWWEYYEKENLQNEGYMHSFWQRTNNGCKKMFDEIFPERVHSFTKEDYIKIIKNNNLINSGKWWEYYKNNNLEKKGYSRYPWERFKISLLDFFNMAFPERVHSFTKEDYIKIIKDNNLTSLTKWKRYYENNNLKEKGYILNIPQYFNKKAKEFFDEIFPERVHSFTKKDYVKIIKNNNLFNSSLWFDYYDKNGLKEKGYYKNPWATYDLKISDFFYDIFPPKKEKDYVKIMKNNGLTNRCKYREYWRENELQKNRVHSKPWNKFKKSESEFFSQVK